MVNEGQVLWEPSEESKQNANLTKYMSWLESEKKLSFKDYRSLQNWSTSNLSQFWESLFEYFQIRTTKKYDCVIDDENKILGSQWFPGAELNYADHTFRNRDSSKTAIIFRNEVGEKKSISWAELLRETSAVASSLREIDVKKGDRIAAFIPNIPQAIVGFLASASLGAIWSSCSPDFGIPSVVDRFSQIKPKVLIGVDGVQYNGKSYDKSEALRSLQSALPSLEKTILVPYSDAAAKGVKIEDSLSWEDLVSSSKQGAKLEFESVPFSHPLWILYSSGTTGLPKPLVHSHGGILLEHLKALYFHNDLKAEDRLFWYTTTGWMMWNYIVGGLLLGSTIILYDGNPTYPSMNAMWDLAEETGMTIFGTSAAYVGACMKSDITPGSTHNLGKLKSVCSTASPLSVDSFAYLYQKVKGDLWVVSMSGGTDVCTAFVGGCPLLPVYAGEIQSICLGADVRALDENGKSILNETGELVLAKPMPSMPVFLWGDEGNRRYSESYFEIYPNVWRHGDWIKITDRGTCLIYGRSDSTIKKMGVRMGTSEIYRATESLPEIQDCLAVDLGGAGKQSVLVLFVVPSEGNTLDANLKDKIRKKIRTDLSPRFVPDEIISAPEIPKTLNGKKMEVPVKRILMGAPVNKVLSLDSMANPKSIEFYEKIRLKMPI